MTATTQGRRAEVVAWLLSWDSLDDPLSGGNIVFERERGAINRAEEIREEYPEDTVTITPLVPADTLAEMQRRVEACEALVSKWGTDGRYLNSKIMRDCVLELRATLGGDAATTEEPK